jgi:hypothetical protein
MIGKWRRPGEFLDRQRHGMLADQPGSLVGAAGLPGAMVAAVERHQILVENRQTGFCGALAISGISVTDEIWRKAP